MISHSYQDGFTSGDLTHTHLASVQVPPVGPNEQLGRWKVTATIPLRPMGLTCMKCMDFCKMKWYRNQQLTPSPSRKSNQPHPIPSQIPETKLAIFFKGYHPAQRIQKVKGGITSHWSCPLEPGVDPTSCWQRSDQGCRGLWWLGPPVPTSSRVDLGVPCALFLFFCWMRLWLLLLPWFW